MENKRNIVNENIDKITKGIDHVLNRKVVGNDLLQEELDQNEQESIVKR